MKILFLDFDGVLNSENYIRKCNYIGLILDPECMLLLKNIIDTTGALIVLSTSWREHWNKHPSKCDEIGNMITEKFKEYGLSIFDKTQKLNAGREAEIKKWLNMHNNIQSFVVLDDRFLYADYLKGHFVKTANYRNGLDKQNMSDAIRILNGNEVF